MNVFWELGNSHLLPAMVTFGCIWWLKFPTSPFCPFHGWALASAPRMHFGDCDACPDPFWATMSTDCSSFCHFPLFHLLKKRKDRIDYAWVFSEKNLVLVQVHLEERWESHSALLGWWCNLLMVWPNTVSKELPVVWSGQLCNVQLWIWNGLS